MIWVQNKLIIPDLIVSNEQIVQIPMWYDQKNNFFIIFEEVPRHISEMVLINVQNIKCFCGLIMAPAAAAVRYLISHVNWEPSPLPWSLFWGNSQHVFPRPKCPVTNA